ncbi:MAG: hypothetical protein JRH20_17820 [Deltaproteobacteria bacterium]|nr:hypothetical protein [Deltaproteobacteria bacterium]
MEGLLWGLLRRLRLRRRRRRRRLRRRRRRRRRRRLRLRRLWLLQRRLMALLILHLLQIPWGDGAHLATLHRLWDSSPCLRLLVV